MLLSSLLYLVTVLGILLPRLIKFFPTHSVCSRDVRLVFVQAKREDKKDCFYHQCSIFFPPNLTSSKILNYSHDSNIHSFICSSLQGRRISLIGLEGREKVIIISLDISSYFYSSTLTSKSVCSSDSIFHQFFFLLQGRQLIFLGKQREQDKVCYYCCFYISFPPNSDSSKNITCSGDSIFHPHSLLQECHINILVGERQEVILISSGVSEFLLFLCQIRLRIAACTSDSMLHSYFYSSTSVISKKEK